MVLELMSNGTLAELPRAALPDGVLLPDGPSVVLLLPRNRYLLGTIGQPVPGGVKGPAQSGGERWFWGRPGEKELRAVFLYDGAELTLPDDSATVTLPAAVTSRLKNELLRQVEPPGEHAATVLIARSFMREHPAFAGNFQDEATFMTFLKEDEVLSKVYWTLRFALPQGELDEVVRLKAWLKAGPELFTNRGEADEGGMRMWFSLLDTPDDDALSELEALSFSREDLNHMVKQQISPLILFNPRSGYLVLARFGRDGGASFLVWSFLPPALWGELRERRKLPVHDLILALWGQHDIECAMAERSRYKAWGQDVKERGNRL